MQSRCINKMVVKGGGLFRASGMPRNGDYQKSRDRQYQGRRRQRQLRGDDGHWVHHVKNVPVAACANWPSEGSHRLP
jgi:hypothetical protein